MLVDADGNFLVTNDGASLLESLDIEHPVYIIKAHHTTEPVTTLMLPFLSLLVVFTEHLFRCCFPEGGDSSGRTEQNARRKCW